VQNQSVTGIHRELAAAILAVPLALAGCAGEPPSPSPSLSASASASSSSTTSTTASAVSDGKHYSVTTTSIGGTTLDRNGTWKAKFGQLAGGDPAVVEAFNGASQAAVHRQVARATADTREATTSWHLESNGQVTFRRVAITQLINGALGDGAHPTTYIGTVVIDSRTAKPITLADLFSDEPAGLQRLSEQTKLGVAPTDANFANWIPTADGIEIHFAQDQPGVQPAQTVTVPWPALNDVLAPGMVQLAQD
jgi:hypothetical protein